MHMFQTECKTLPERYVYQLYFTVMVQVIMLKSIHIKIQEVLQTPMQQTITHSQDVYCVALN